ncbi:MAG: sigma 54-interacting transcriptional regulator [Acidobacteria bacterium]|nr:sigma 54-interacting transcriptional regulator [Acidobacteriota bacterium]
MIQTAPIQDGNGRMEGVVVTFKDVTDQTEPQNRSFVTESPRMRQILNFIRKVASSEASSILIEGESGTGKDLIAKTIHYQSMRQAQPFIAINCSAIPDNLLEAELFGYEKGSFTDAKNQKRGLIELADKGSLLLDEIGEMPLILQAKMLRVLEDQRVRRIGGVRDFSVDVRVIAVTNRNLQEAVRAGAFRQDLYYRLNVIQIYIPPLRERPEDILPLIHFFISHYNNKFKRKIHGMAPDAEKLLQRYYWPGNVRELRNAIERAMILEDSALLRATNLPISLNRPEPPATPDGLDIPENGISLEQTERELISRALAKTNGNQTHAARLLSITRDTLRYKMKKYQLS